jgi:hypothetical protein
MSDYGLEKLIQVRHVHFRLIFKVVRHICRRLVAMFTSLSETGQHMPLICVHRSHVFCSIDLSVSYMHYCQVIHILSNRIDPGSKHCN